MRSLLAVVILGVAATAANAQAVWVGAGLGTSWEYEPQTVTNTTWLHRTANAPTIFAAFPMDQDAQVRISASDVPYDALHDGLVFDGKFRALTAGVDYFFAGAFGRFVFGGGIGDYKLDLAAKQPPAGVEKSYFGWYLSTGEWFQLTRRSRIIVEITMHRPSSPGHPSLFTAVAGVALGF